MRLPDKYTDYMKRLLKEDYPLYEDSLLMPRFFGLRVNNLKISTEDFLKISPFKLKPVPWTDNGFYYDESERPATHPFYHAGLYYIQEPSAMAPAACLPAEPGDTVLDLCAAPGGKSTQLGIKIKNEGLLVSNDVSASRAAALLKNIELFGFSEMSVISEEPYRINETAGLRPDRILIDAPCSGEGMFRKDTKLISAWEQNGPEFFSKIQKEISVHMGKLLKPGGYMLYSTCTFNKHENEEVIINLLKQNTDLELVDIPKNHGFKPGFTDTQEEKSFHLEKCARLFPFALEGEGHFLALLKKKGSDENNAYVNTAYDIYTGTEKTATETREFLSLIKREFKQERIRLSGGKVFYMPERAFFGSGFKQGIRYIRNGLLLGEEKKNRFEPSQALAMNLSMEEYPYCVSLKADDVRTDKYLKGEGIELLEKELSGIPDKSCVLLCTEGFPLGWGKLVGSKLKNKYLPGWRKQ